METRRAVGGDWKGRRETTHVGRHRALEWREGKAASRWSRCIARQTSGQTDEKEERRRRRRRAAFERGGEEQQRQSGAFARRRRRPYPELSLLLLQEVERGGGRKYEDVAFYYSP